MTGEEWKRITLKNMEYNYFVSNLGRVKNAKGLILKPWKSGLRKGTYYCVRLSRHGFLKKEYVHRLVALHFVPNPNGKPEVNHLNLDHFNNRADNLEWCTRSENMMHSFFMAAHVGIEQELAV